MRILHMTTGWPCIAKPWYNFDLSSWKVETSQSFLFCQKIISLSFLDFQRHMVGSLVVHTPILSLHLHEYSNVVSKSEGNASALIFFFQFHYDAFCPLLTKHAESGSKRRRNWRRDWRSNFLPLIHLVSQQQVEKIKVYYTCMEYVNGYNYNYNYCHLSIKVDHWKWNMKQSPGISGLRSFFILDPKRPKQKAEYAILSLALDGLRNLRSMRRSIVNLTNLHVGVYF